MWFAYNISQFVSIEEKMIARSLLYWINDGSHSIPDDLFIDSYTDAVPRYKEVFRAIFEKSNHIAHYNMMMGIKDETGDDGISWYINLCDLTPWVWTAKDDSPSPLDFIHRLHQ